MPSQVDKDLEEYILMTNQIAIIISILGFFYIPLFILFHIPFILLLCVILLVIGYISVLPLNHFNYFNLSRFLVSLIGPIGISFFAYLYGFSMNFHLNLLISIAIPYAIYRLSEYFKIFIALLIVFGSYTLIKMPWIMATEGHLAFSPIASQFIKESFFYMALFYIAFIIYLFSKANHKKKQEIETQKKWLSTVLYSIGDAVIATDENGLIQFMNPSAKSITGWSLSEAQYRHINYIFKLINGETHSEIELGSEKVLNAGQIIWLEKNTVLITKSLLEVPVDTSCAPITDDNGQILGMVLAFRDISKQKDSEKEKRCLEHQLYETRKMEAIGTLAAGMAHEINTPIQFISDNLKFIERSIFMLLTRLEQVQPLMTLSESETQEFLFVSTELPAALSQSSEGLARVTKIVKAMKDFSHRQSEDVMVRSNLNEAIESSLIISQSEYKYAADIETHLAPDLPVVACFIDDLKQVILNLIINAAHAIKDVPQDDSSKKGKMIITTLFDTQSVTLLIKDTGTGIKEEIRNKVFDPFFTTKPIGVGSGQGLALAYSCIVKKHKGQITFETEVGVGTEFKIILPLI